VSIRIERLGHLGDGIAAGPVFAPRCLPGEVVDGTLDGQRLQNVRILEPSDHRVKPLCSVYKSCGGCSLQHADDEFVRDWKAEVVRTALEAHGIDAPIRAIHTSPTSSRRRAKFTARRTKSGALVGFAGRASHVLVDAHECQVVSPDILKLWPFLEEATRQLATRKSTIEISVTLASPGQDVAISGSVPLTPHLIQDLAAASGRAGVARLTVDGEVVALHAPPLITMGAAKVPVPAGAFLQATAHGEAALVSAVQEALEGRRRLADLFSGAGTFTFPLAEKARVAAFDSVPELVFALEQGRNQGQGLREIGADVRDLFRNPLLPAELAQFDGVVIDPPRAGAEAQCDALLKSDVPVIAYVSCDPTSFARDVASLGPAYAIDWIDVVDQFRWSTHVELVAKLTRRDITSA